METGQTLGAVGYLGGGLYRGILGISQLSQAKKLAPKRPEYQIPGAMNEQVALYRGLANQSQVPGHAIIADDLNRSTSSAIDSINRASGSAQDIIGSASMLAGNQIRGLSDLTIAGAQMQRQAQGMYANSLGMLAQYQDRAFDINKMIPYLNEERKKEALKAAGHANIYGGFQDIGSYGMELQNQQNQANASGGGGGALDLMSLASAGGGGGAWAGASPSALGSATGGAASAGAAAAAAGSDRRIKEKIHRIGTSGTGIGIYLFEYIQSEQMPGLFLGAMADEVEMIEPNAVYNRADGFKGVYYHLIDVPFLKIDR